MSDLQCAASLILARHADAVLAEDGGSDARCSLTSEGRAQASALADALAGRRIAAVYASDVLRAVQTAEIVATRLGVAVTARESLREVPLGAPTGEAFDTGRLEGGESGDDVVERHRAQFEEIADLHRGETVLVVGHPSALGIVVPSLVDNLTLGWARDHPLESTERAELDRDADGWVLRCWGSSVRAC